MSETLQTTLLSDHVLWSMPDAVRDRPILGAFLGSNGTMLADTGASAKHAAQMRAALTEINAPPLRYAALTHWHWDHVFGTAELGLPTLAHTETRQRVLEMAQLDWRDRALDQRVADGKELAFIADHMKVELSNLERAVLEIAAPEITFSDAVELDLGDMTVQVLHVGGDHSSDCSVIYSAQAGVAFLGDCLYNRFIGKQTAYTLKKLIPLVDCLVSLPVETYVLGHHPGPMPRESFQEEVDYLRHVGEMVEAVRDREAILAQFPKRFGQPLTPDDLDVIDSFLVGLNL